LLFVSPSPTPFCLGWRQTQGCLATGIREPELDLACDDCVPSKASGFCECVGELRIQLKCDHKPMTCNQQCAIELRLGHSASSACNSAHWMYQIRPSNDVHATCQLQSAPAEWDPWAGEPEHSCGISAFQVTVVDGFNIVSSLPQVECEEPRCTIGQSNRWINVPPTAPFQVQITSNAADYIRCTCNGRGLEYHPLAQRAQRSAITQAQQILPVGPRRMPWNVVYVMMDSLSRAHFHRAFPKTARILLESNSQMMKFTI
jgi:hypothetical protein